MTLPSALVVINTEICFFFRSTGFGVGHLSSWRENASGSGIHLKPSYICIIALWDHSTHSYISHWKTSWHHQTTLLYIPQSVSLCLCWCFLQFSHRLLGCAAETHETSPCPVCRLWTGWVSHLSNFCLLIGIPLRLISMMVIFYLLDGVYRS